MVTIKYLSIMILAAFLNSGHCLKTYILIQKPPQTIGCGRILYAGQFIFIDAKDSIQTIGIIKCPDGYDSSAVIQSILLSKAQQIA